MQRSTLERNPTDLEREEALAEERQRLAMLALEEDRKDLIWSLSGPRGRRRFRRELEKAGLYTRSDFVDSVFDKHHGTMCGKEALRTSVLQQIWPLLRLLAAGKLPFDHFQLLMTETDG